MKVNKNTLKKMLRENKAIIEHCYDTCDHHNNYGQASEIVNNIPAEFFKRNCWASLSDGVYWLNSYTDWYKIRF